MKIKKGDIVNIINQEYKRLQRALYLENLSLDDKMRILSKRDTVLSIMNEIEELEIHLNGGIIRGDNIFR